MRGTLWIVAALALATSLDASLYDGRYVQTAARIASHIGTYFR